MMRKIILDLTTSLDGFIEGPNQEIDWILFDKETADILNQLTAEIDTVFYGRVSYEMWGNYNPPEDSMKEIIAFYAAVNSLKKYVFSRNLSKAEGAAILINENFKQSVLDIKDQPGNDIWLFGGADLITSFMNENLIDEYRISIQPVVLGAGKPLFNNLQHRTSLKLIKSKVHQSGIVSLYYRKT